jgi:flagellum-specific ATP synthase
MAWSGHEAALVARTRAIIARYEEAEPMIQAGLYTAGTDPAIDEAIALWPALDRFVGTAAEGESSLESFARLSDILALAGHGPAKIRGAQQVVGR